MNGWHPDDVDYKAQAEKFHRRAQKAEGLLGRRTKHVVHWRSQFNFMVRNNRTTKRALRRAQARLMQMRWKDDLTRIIELGRMFP